MRTHTLPLATGTPGFGVSRTERLVCVVEIQVHARVSIKKNATPISQPVWLGVGIEDPSGVVEIQVHSWGTLEKTLIYIFSHKHMHVHTRLFVAFLRYCSSLTLQMEYSPVTPVKNMKKIPSQHVAPCNGNAGYPLPTRARTATGDKYPGGAIRNAIAFEDPTHSRSDGAKAPIAIHIRIPVRRGRPLPLGLSPRRM